MGLPADLTTVAASQSKSSHKGELTVASQTHKSPHLPNLFFGIFISVTRLVCFRLKVVSLPLTEQINIKLYDV